MRILLVDDETELTEPLTRVLRREGYEVEVAHDGDSAVKQIQAARVQADPGFHLLILDWMLPKRSGIDLCQDLRSQGNLTPVLFLTAKDTLDDQVRGLDSGADDYLVKPFELRHLLAKVRAILRRHPQWVGRPSPRLLVDGLDLDLENQLVYYQGQTLHLSEKETHLLAFFLDHPGQLLTHEQLCDHLWPQGEKPSSNVLAAQIRLLRRKIEVGSTPLIHSIYGKGYRFGVVPD